MKRVLFICVLAFSITSCETASQLLSGMGSAGSETYEPSDADKRRGLRDALQVGIVRGANLASKKDGYFKNAAIKILWPEEAARVEQAMRNLGMGNLCDKATESFNRAAEKAAVESKDIFVNAIKQLTFTDVMDILFGEEDAATNFLRRTTTADLRSRFLPVIERSMESVNATKYWDDVITRYNKIPLVQKINPDIEEFVTDKALDGLFHMLSQEEKKIRAEPLARSTEMLNKVFSWVDKQRKG